MVTNIALMGAGDKMGTRITNNIKNLPDYAVAYVEVSEQGIANLKAHGQTPTPQAEALAKADVVVLALPDKLVSRISHAIVPTLRPQTMIVGLDPAAAYAEAMPIRDDLTYFVAHPCHPPLFNDDIEPNAVTDWFGGIHAAQQIVCALHHGPEADYAKGEAIARAMYQPVIEAHRVTVEQMAILEPALVETFSATLLMTIKEVLDEAIRMGVPEKAARAFLMGHLRIELAIIFGFAGFPFSDGAKLAIENAKSRIFLPDWKDNVMSLDSIRKSVTEITDTIGS